MDEQAERDHIHTLLTTYRRNLRILEHQIGVHGGADLAPVGILNQAEQARRSIGELEQQLALLNGAIAPGASVPYPGLLAFGREQSDIFYGRETECGELLALVRATPIVMVIGASGSGKSSLVMAGLLPQLDPSWRVLCLMPGARPLRALADQLATLGPPDQRLQLADLLEERLARRPDGLSSGISTLLAEHLPDMRLLVVIDQLEELFTQLIGTPEQIRLHQRQLILNLKDAARDAGERLRLVLTMRADFLGQWLNVPDIPRDPVIGQFLLRPMSESARRRVIAQPAEQAGAQFEHGLVERLLADTRDQPAALPLLQFTLAQLWQRRNEQWITHAAYEEIGGVSGALDQRASAVYSQLSESQQRLARNLFVRLVTMHEELSYTRRRVQRDELDLAGVKAEDIERLIGILSRGDVRLIAAEADGVELAHEALIDHWSELRGWLDANRERLLALRRLTETAMEWRSHQRDPSFLYRGARLAEAQRIAADAAADLNLLEQLFLARSRAAAQWRRAIRILGAAAGALLALALMLALWTESGPFQPTIIWESPADLAGKDVTTLEWSADGSMYAGLAGAAAGSGLVARSTDRGLHWRLLSLSGTFVSSMQVDPTEIRRVYAALLPDGVYRSEDAGEHWQRLDPGLELTRVVALAVSPDGALYAGSLKGGGVYASTNHGSSWSRVPGAPDAQVYKLRWSPRCAGEAAGCLMVGAKDGLWRLSSAGRWARLIAQGPIVDVAQVGDATVAGGQSLLQLHGGVVQMIADEPISTIDVSVDAQPEVLIGGAKGNLWRWRPGDSALRSLPQDALAGISNVNIVRAAGERPMQIWVGSNRGLHHGRWQRWYEFR